MGVTRRDSVQPLFFRVVNYLGRAKNNKTKNFVLEESLNSICAHISHAEEFAMFDTTV